MRVILGSAPYRERKKKGSLERVSGLDMGILSSLVGAESLRVDRIMDDEASLFYIVKKEGCVRYRILHLM